MSFDQLSKKDWRDHFKNQLQDWLPVLHEKNFFTIQWMKVLQFFFSQQDQGVWGSFFPLLGEPPIGEYSLSDKSKIKWVFPKINGNEIEFYESQDFETHHWGMLQPKNGVLFSPDQINGILIPGLGFDHFGNRMGRGKGFYDRYLSKFIGLKVGCCYNFQFITQALATDSWDVSMDMIMTEEGIKHMKKTELKG